MKRNILIIGVVLMLTMATAVFAGGRRDGMMMGGQQGINATNNCVQPLTQLTTEQQESVKKITDQLAKDVQPIQLDLRQKQLEIDKLLLADAPDWTKIEKLTQEQSALTAKIHLATLKAGKEIKKITGVDFPMGLGMGAGGKMGRGMGMGMMGR